MNIQLNPIKILQRITQAKTRFKHLSEQATQVQSQQQVSMMRDIAVLFVDYGNLVSIIVTINRQFMALAKIAKCCIIYTRLQGHVPTYLKSLLKLSCETHSPQTRYANFNLACPIVTRQKEGGKTFTVTTCKLWNSLPLTTRKLATLSSFKKSLWQNIFNNQQVLNHFIL